MNSYTSQYQNPPLIIENTNVKFFILGEWKFQKHNPYMHLMKESKVNESQRYREETLLVRSKNTNLEIIGQNLYKDLDISITTINRNQGVLGTTIKILESTFFPISKKSTTNQIKFLSESKNTNRMAEYKFCWEGIYKIKNKDRNELQELLQKSARRIIKSLEDEDLRELEINLAPIIYVIELINKKDRKIIVINKIFSLSIMATYLAFTLIFFTIRMNL